MSFLKFLIGPMILAANLPAEGVDGWYVVERGRGAEEGREVEDPSIWALFVKDLGKEKFSVRFPDEPTYRYLEDGALEITAIKDEIMFQVVVSKINSSVFGGPDISYQVGEKWVHEHFEVSDEYFFSFKVENLSPNGEILRDLFSTFSIEKSGSNFKNSCTKS